MPSLRPSAAGLGRHQSRLMAGLALCWAGCAFAEESALRPMGMVGVPLPGVVQDNLIFVDAPVVNGHAGGRVGRMLVDTGSPFTVIDPALFPDTDLDADLVTRVRLEFGAFRLDDVSVVRLKLGLMQDLSVVGVLGGDVLRHFAATLDFGRGTLQLDVRGPTPQPGDTLIPFTLEGGGSVASGLESLEFPATRILFQAMIEGQPCGWVLDTGATVTVTTSELFSRLVRDGRPVIEGYPLASASGPVQARITRARSFTVAGNEAVALPVMDVGGGPLDVIEREVGRPLCGLPGGAFFNGRKVTVDYSARTVHLHHCPECLPAPDQFQRVGAELAVDPVSRGMMVSYVYSNSDAERKGVSVGDDVLSIDGHAATNRMEAARLLLGIPGHGRRLEFGRTTRPLLEGTQLDVLIDDLIPLPTMGTLGGI